MELPGLGLRGEVSPSFRTHDDHTTEENNLTVATEPNTAALAQSVEASFLNPLKTAGDAYRKAAAYVAALPETSDSDKVGSLRSWFLSGAEKLKDRTLRPSEMDYIHGKCAHAALEIGFYRGDIAYDWRH